MALRAALLILLNILFFAVVSSTNCPPPPSTEPIGHHHHSSPVCPRDALKLTACGNLLTDLINLSIGHPPSSPCCSLLGGLVDLEAAACLCHTMKATILGINLADLNGKLSLLLNHCGRKVPHEFNCI